MNLTIFNVASITKVLFPHDIVFKRFIYFLCMWVYVCLCTTCGSGPVDDREVTRSLEIRVTDSCEAPYGY